MSNDDLSEDYVDRSDLAGSPMRSAEEAMRQWLLAFVLVGIGVGVGLVTTRILEKVDRDRAATATVFRREQGLSDVRVWEIANVASDGEDLPVNLVIRQRREPRAPDVDAKIDEDPLGRDEGDEGGGEIVIGGALAKGTPTLRVSMETLDVRDCFAISDEEHGLPLRMFVRIASGGAGAFSRDRKEILAGDKFAGSFHVESPEWNGDEMHLCNVLTVSEEETSTYSVLLRRGD
jgi:hypothetical protein